LGAALEVALEDGAVLPLLGTDDQRARGAGLVRGAQGLAELGYTVRCLGRDAARAQLRHDLARHPRELRPGPPPPPPPPRPAPAAGSGAGASSPRAARPAPRRPCRSRAPTASARRATG